MTATSDKPTIPDFGTFGRYQGLRLDEMTPDQKKAYEFTTSERGEVPGPYKISLQNPKLIDVMVPLGAYYQGLSSLSKAEIEIATNLTNPRWLAGYSNYENEIIGERDAYLRPHKVEALIAGLYPTFDDPRQQVVYDVTSALLAPRKMPTGRSCGRAAGWRRPHRLEGPHRLLHVGVPEPSSPDVGTAGDTSSATWCSWGVSAARSR